MNLLVVPNSSRQATALLTPGPCGAEPPRASRWVYPRNEWKAGDLPNHPDLRTERALVLAWEGVTVLSGVDWLGRVLDIADPGWRADRIFALEHDVGIVVGQIQGFDRSRAMVRVDELVSPLLGSLICVGGEP